MPLYRHTKLPPPPELGEKTVWQYLPRHTLRRVVLLLVALGAVLVLKRSGSWSLGGLFDAPPKTAPVYHLEVTPREGPRSAAPPTKSTP